MLSLIAARELRHGGIPPALCVVVRKREDALYLLLFSDSFIVGTGDRFKNVRIDLIPQEIDSMFALADEEEFEVVLGHHDLQHGNILRNADGDMIFVDFESLSLPSLNA